MVIETAFQEEPAGTKHICLRRKLSNVRMSGLTLFFNFVSHKLPQAPHAVTSTGKAVVADAETGRGEPPNNDPIAIN